MTRKTFSQSAAFSLVEVILALGIVSFCLLALLGTFASGLKSSRESEKDTFLSEMAGILLNDRVANGSPTHPDTGYITSDGEIDAHDGVYAYAVSVTPFTGSGVPSISTNLNKISITFRWPKGLDPQNQQSLVFYSSTLRSGSSSAP